MCGIVGLMGLQLNKTFPIFHNMLMVDVIRGKDSTGIISVNENDHVRTFKNIGLPHNVIYDNRYQKKVVNGKSNKLLIGHNRAATFGDVIVDNAHPFMHGNIAMVHNGTIYNKGQLSIGSAQVFNTDSEAICWAVNHYGIEWVWERLDGAAVLVYWDMSDNTLNIISNGRRPFAFGYSKGFNRLLFASEPWMFMSIAKREGMEIETSTICAPEPHHLFTFRYDKKTARIDETYTKLEPRKMQTYVNVHCPFLEGEAHPYNPQQHNKQLTQDKKKEEEKSLKNLDPWADQEVWEDEDQFSRDKGGIKETEFHAHYTHCCSCGDSLELEFEEALIIDDRKALCDGCATVAEKEGIKCTAF